MRTISTRWSKDLATLQPDAVELDARASPKEVRAIVASGVRVASVHAPCPAPVDLPPETHAIDLFQLTHLDADQHKRAVEGVIRSIELANSADCDRVVLHLGHADGDRPTHLDAVRYALDRLVRAAERHGVRIGIEGRSDPDDLPTTDELRPLLSEFHGAPLGYWHDLGHGHLAQAHGAPPQANILRLMAEHLVGVHVSDVDGDVPHALPGSGPVDFPTLLPLVADSVPLVVEVDPGPSEAALHAAFDWLTGLH